MIDLEETLEWIQNDIEDLRDKIVRLNYEVMPNMDCESLHKNYEDFLLYDERLKRAELDRLIVLGRMS